MARAASLVYALVSGAYLLDTYRRPGLAVVVLALMVGWTVAVSLLLRSERWRTPWLLGVDLAVAVLALLSGVLVQDPARLDDPGDPTLTLTWGAVPVVAWAVRGGAPAAAAAALVMSAATVLWRGDLTRPTIASCVLMLLVGVVVGYVVTLARRAEAAYADVVQREAAQAERSRLAREVHDGVLQTLALVTRRSPDAELAELARQQEQALRRLVSEPAAVATGTADLCALLPVGVDVQLAAPAGPVPLPGAVAAELAAAVQACLDNVRQHAGGRAWVLVEDEADAVTVSVRDEGPGIAPGRLAQAEQQGRLGVSRSIRGRLAALGGTVAVTSTPGEGTEVELRVPRS